MTIATLSRSSALIIPEVAFGAGMQGGSEATAYADIAVTDAGVMSQQGQIVWEDGGTYTPASVFIPFAAVTAFNQAKLRLRTAGSAGSGPVGVTPYLSDELTISAAPTANAYNEFALTGASSLASGDFVAVWLEGVSAVPGDNNFSVRLREVGLAQSHPSASSASGGTHTGIPCVVFKSTGGSPKYGVLYGTSPLLSAQDTLFYASGGNYSGVNMGTYNELGTQFSPRYAVEVDGIFASAVQNTSTTIELAWGELSVSTPSAPTRSGSWTTAVLGRDKFIGRGTSQPAISRYRLSAPITLDPAKVYGITIRNTSSSDATIRTLGMQRMLFGQAEFMTFANALNIRALYRNGGAGAYTATQGQLFSIGFCISGFHDGAGSTAPKRIIGGG